MKQDWMTLEAFWQHCRTHPVSPLLRLLLSSDGTMVRAFTGLFLEPTALQVVEQGDGVIDEALSQTLGVPIGEKAMKRRVWLRARRGRSGYEKCLYAVSIFPISKIQPNLYQDIRLGKKPIGRMIEDRRLATWRDALEIAYLPNPDAAEGLALPEDTCFWTRRYRLTMPGQLLASIREVISPQLSSFSS
ncbi:MAG: chorismate--pyruvate lyase family protein [Nitrospiria bacterium]